MNVRQKWTPRNRNLEGGDNVIVDEPDTPRGLWQVGIIDQVFRSKGGIIRKAFVRLANKNLDRHDIPIGEPTVLERSILKLVLFLPGQDLAM